MFGKQRHKNILIPVPDDGCMEKPKHVARFGQKNYRLFVHYKGMSYLKVILTHIIVGNGTDGSVVYVGTHI
jgi:hypothetical protein